MLHLNNENLKETAAWAQAGIALPRFDRQAMIAQTALTPQWVHFGTGNIFRSFIAVLQQDLLDAGLSQTGIVAVAPYDLETIEKVYAPYDNLCLAVTMFPDGTTGKRVVGSIAQALPADSARTDDWQTLQRIFAALSLQMISFTITEKGYNLTDAAGEFTATVQQDMANGPSAPQNAMAKVAALLYARFQNGRLPVALVSMDNLSHNGDKLRQSLLAITERWQANGLVADGFVEYLSDPVQVAFPLTMIDKIVPRPSDAVKDVLHAIGFANANWIQTQKKTFVAPFVNGEETQYLVVEDRFPNGRPPLEAAGVYLTDRATVDKVEKMKVCTCLNPLHTTLAIFGCLLGYDSIAAEMTDSTLVELIKRVGYAEGLPVVVNPGIIDPKAFIDEVVGKRLPNPYTPDTPQRIATDTSQKLGVRFGETIKAYVANPALGVDKLTFIPLVLAGWCRYLLDVDDAGNAMTPSPDPLLNTLQTQLAAVKPGQPASLGVALRPILADAKIFGVDLYKAGLGQRIEGYLQEMLDGNGAVRATLKQHLGEMK